MAELQMIELAEQARTAENIAVHAADDKDKPADSIIMHPNSAMALIVAWRQAHPNANYKGITIPEGDTVALSFVKRTAK